MQATFRFQGKRVFLTYANVVQDIQLVEWENFFKLKFPSQMVYHTIGRELHESGVPHFHVLIVFDRKIDTRSVTFFDFKGQHPNIISPNDLEATKIYVQKDGNYIEEGDFPATKKRKAVDDAWEAILNEATDNVTFMALAKAKDPKNFVLNHEKLEYFAAKHYAVKRTTYVSPYANFIVPSDVQGWVQDHYLSQQRRKKSLFLIGPSKLGKTEWARSLGRHMYFNGATNFKDDWDDDAEYLVFDDIDWNFIPQKKGFFGCQQEFVINGKYMRSRSIKWGKPVIYCANNDPRIEDHEIDWYKMNTVKCFVNKRMY